jgi:hypothetical protein
MGRSIRHCVPPAISGATGTARYIRDLRTRNTMSATIRIVPRSPPPVVHMNLLELPRPLLKRHARFRVGTPTNSVSVIHFGRNTTS